MRAMLIANIAVDQRFANGTQGRALHWSPDAAAKTSKAVPTYSPEVLVRFCKESSTTEPEMTPGDSIFVKLNTQSAKNSLVLGTLPTPFHPRRPNFPAHC